MKKLKSNNNLSDIEFHRTNNVQEEKPEQKFDKELLVKSKRLEEFHLHPDMIRAILVKPEYTISDAKLAIQKYIDSFNQ